MDGRVGLVTIADLVQGWAERTPAGSALLAEGRETLCYRALAEQIRRAGAQLNAMGIGREDRVAVVLADGPEMAAAFLAIASYATFAPLNPAYRREEFSFYLSDLHAKVLIVGQGVDSPARDAAAERGIPVIELAWQGQREAGLFTLQGPCLGQAARAGMAGADDVALVLHTSGTTSRPKRVPLTHLNICLAAMNQAEVLRLTPQDRGLQIVSLFHIHGLVTSLLSSMAAGASVVCTPGFQAPLFFQWLGQHRPTWYTAAPTMHAAILLRAAENAAIIADCSLRLVRSASAPLPTKVLAEIERLFGVPMIEGYGMTETSPIISSNPLPPGRRKPGSVGRPVGCEVAIMDEAGALVARGQTGEIAVRGHNVTRGYEDDPAANAAAFIHGWFHTGDVGYVDEDGDLFITGRLKEIINRGGEKIAPREVDEALLARAAVAEAVTFAMPDGRLGEDVAAAVVLKAAAIATEAELRDHVARRLADFKVPRRIVFLKTLPRGATGKLQRVGLAEKLGLKAEESSGPSAYVAPRTQLEQQLLEIWQRWLRREGIGINDGFADVGGDSVTAAQVVADIRQDLGVPLPLHELFDHPTVAKLARWVGARASASSVKRVVCLTRAASDVALFCIPGRGGHAVNYRELAMEAEGKLAVYGLDYPDAGNSPAIDVDDIEAIAADFRAQLEAAYPAGPVHLCGYSLGGFIAYELGRQLLARGRRVPLLALIDTPTPGFFRKPPLRDRLLMHWTRLRQADVPGRIRYLLDRPLWRRLGGSVPRPMSSAGTHGAPPHINYQRRYVPLPYPGTIGVYRASEVPHFVPSADDPTLGWARLAPGRVTSHTLPGVHLQMLKQPCLGLLATHLAESLIGVAQPEASHR